jgi:hypothetical protein
MATIRSAIFPVVNPGQDKSNTNSRVSSSGRTDAVATGIEKSSAAHSATAATSNLAEMNELDSQNAPIAPTPKGFGLYHFNKTKVKEPIKLGQFIDIKI